LITVTAAIIEKDGLILAARKKEGLHLGGRWEFPGGKLEGGETPEECLQRELEEEFSIRCEIGPLLGESIFDYGSKIVRLLGYHATHTDGSFKLTDHDEIRWLSIDELSTLKWAPADIPLVLKIQNKAITEENLLFYQLNADTYIEETIHLNMDEIRGEFINLLPRGGHILDLGCGSGRDSRVFLDHGFIVTATDASEEIAAITGKFLDKTILVQKAQELSEKEKYDGIWACASLLHIPKSEMLNTFRAITAALKPQGIWYMSFKQGNGQRWDDRGRFFNDYSVQTLTRLLNKIARIEILDIYEKTAAGAYGDECWLNVFLKPMK
jgi:mutator protein MutT